jgi:hypothetical protein
MKHHTEPPGPTWTSDHGKEFKLVTSGPFVGWLCYRHPDGQWATSHKPRDVDRIKLLDDLKALRHLC